MHGIVQLFKVDAEVGMEGHGEQLQAPQVDEGAHQDAAQCHDQKQVDHECCKASPALSDEFKADAMHGCKAESLVTLT